MLILTSSSSYVCKDWIKHLAKSPSESKLTFIPTAAEVEPGEKKWLNEDRQALVDIGFNVSDFSLVGKTSEEVKDTLNHTDIVFVAGGNTFFLLQEMNKSGFSELIHDYVNKGGVYVGSSAGSVVAAPDISLLTLDDRNEAPNLTNYNALNLTDILILPHWGNDTFKAGYEEQMKVAYVKGTKIILLTDDQYILIKNDYLTIESVV
jgi:dipeptidase E